MRSPALRVELAPDGRVIAAMLAWLAACIAAIWMAPIASAWSVAATVTVLMLGWPVVCSQLFGLVPRAPVGLTCNARGEWFVHRSDGSSEELELSGRSRVFPGALLLLFLGTSSASRSQLRWMVLVNRSGQGAALRRLRARVALELERRSAPGGWFRSPAGPPQAFKRAGDA